MTSYVLPDYLRSGLRAVICGTAVATASRDRGGYYAGPGNQFWSYLRESGLISLPLGPGTSARILEFGLGLTDLLKTRASSSDRGLTGYDVLGFIRKMERFQPRWIAFHGKEAAKIVGRFRGIRHEVFLGAQTWTVADLPVVVLPSASGSNRDPSRLEGKLDRLDWFVEFADILERKSPR